MGSRHFLTPFRKPITLHFTGSTPIIDLATFFVRGKDKADIAKKIFYQLADASQQRTRQGQELLLSTILEASLRTVYNFPFKPENDKRSNAFNLDQFLLKFREDYLILSEDTRKLWKRVSSRVAKYHRLLRHRNAHPDWLSAKGGSYSKDELEQVTDYMIFLSRFYGYMILGLAGFKVAKPLFPVPIAEWKPMMTITIGKPAQEE